MSGLFFALATLALAAGLHHAGRSFRHGRPVDALLSAGWLVLASVFYLGGLNRIGT